MKFLKCPILLNTNDLKTLAEKLWILKKQRKRMSHLHYDIRFITLNFPVAKSITCFLSDAFRGFQQ